jgi:hypothetical protein
MQVLATYYSKRADGKPTYRFFDYQSSVFRVFQFLKIAMSVRWSVFFFFEKPRFRFDFRLTDLTLIHIINMLYTYPCEESSHRRKLILGRQDWVLPLFDSVFIHFYWASGPGPHFFIQVCANETSSCTVVSVRHNYHSAVSEFRV